MKKMRWRRGAGLALAFGLLACVGAQARQDGKFAQAQQENAKRLRQDYGLSRLDTYEFSSEERDKSDPLATNTLTEGKIREALGEESQNSGHHPPPHGAAPSFLVSFHVRAEDKLEEYGGKTGYVQGVLLVDSHDAATKKLVWRGGVTGVVGRSAVDLRLAEEAAKSAAKMLMEQFGRDHLGF